MISQSERKKYREHAEDVLNDSKPAFFPTRALATYVLTLLDHYEDLLEHGRRGAGSPDMTAEVEGTAQVDSEVDVVELAKRLTMLEKENAHLSNRVAALEDRAAQRNAATIAGRPKANTDLNYELEKVRERIQQGLQEVGEQVRRDIESIKGGLT